MKKICFISFFLSSFLFADDPADIQLIQTLKVKTFPNIILKVQANGLQIGENIFAFDEEFGKWVVRSASNKFVGYYNELSRKWIRYNVKAERSIILSAAVSYDFDFDTTARDSIYAFLVEDEKIVRTRLKEVEFDPIDKSLSNYISLNILPSQKVRNEPGPERAYREWVAGQLEILPKKEPLSNVPRITFMSSVVSRNQHAKNGLVRQTYFSYQSVSSLVGNNEEGSFRVLRLKQTPVLNLKPSQQVVELSGQRVFYTNGTENPVLIDSRSINSEQKMIRVQNLSL